MMMDTLGVSSVQNICFVTDADHRRWSLGGAQSWNHRIDCEIRNDPIGWDHLLVLESCPCTDPVRSNSNTWGVTNICVSSVFSGRFELYILIILIHKFNFLQAVLISRSCKQSFSFNSTCESVRLHLCGNVPAVNMFVEMQRRWGSWKVLSVGADLCRSREKIRSSIMLMSRINNWRKPYNGCLWLSVSLVTAYPGKASHSEHSEVFAFESATASNCQIWALVPCLHVSDCYTLPTFSHLAAEVWKYYRPCNMLSALLSISAYGAGCRSRMWDLRHRSIKSSFILLMQRPGRGPGSYKRVYMAAIWWWLH